MITHVRNGEIVRVRDSSCPGLPIVDYNGVTMDSITGDPIYFRVDSYAGGFRRDRVTINSSFIVERLV